MGAGLKRAAVVDSYNYDQTELGKDADQAAKEDAARIAPGGTPATQPVTGSGAAYLFRSDRVLVVYEGSDPRVVQLLSDALGPPFAVR
jgi:hypothetical protein